VIHFSQGNRGIYRTKLQRHRALGALPPPYAGVAVDGHHRNVVHRCGRHASSTGQAAGTTENTESTEPAIGCRHNFHGELLRAAVEAIGSSMPVPSVVLCGPCGAMLPVTFAATA